MKHLALPPMAPRRLPFYLAMEEWAALTLPADEYFFEWRVAPSVICGRNQDIAREVDLDYCRREGIDVVRRKSGGGAVYADMDNYMFSYITPGSEVTSTFSRYTTMIVAMLGALGIEARATGRNDILIGNGKVAGNAFYHTHGRSIAHGTMLYDFDPGRLLRAITPSRAKLESKAVTSTPMRVTSLKANGIKLGLEECGAFAVDFLCKDEQRELSIDDIAEIEAIEQTYYDPEYFNGHNRQNRGRVADISRHKRVEGVGEFDIAINLAPDSTIEGLGIWGDFFVSGDINSDIIEPLTGVGYNKRSLSGVISTLEPSAVITGLSRSNLLNLLI